MYFTIRLEDGHAQKHTIVFDEEPLTLNEMFSVGFLGDMEIIRPDGRTDYVEIDASPSSGDHSAGAARFDFRILYAGTQNPYPASVTGFNYSKKAH